MPETFAPQLPAEHPEHHEHSDAQTWGIWIFIGVFVVLLAITFAGLYGLFAFLGRHNTPFHPVASAPSTAIFPEPRIQGLPSYHAARPQEDLASYITSERHILTTYAPTTQPGYVRIPISRAIDLTLSSHLLSSTTQPGGTDVSP